MSILRRLMMIRHGETVGNSSVRFYGRTDVALSDEGRTQMRSAADEVRGESFEVVVGSPLSRSWEAASIVGGGAPVRLESNFAEIDFGRWEGLTREEIEASDPVLCSEWQENPAVFDFPEGEKRADFRERVLAGLARVESSGASGALLVVHKGIIRTIAEQLLGEPLPLGKPDLGGRVDLTRTASGAWISGRRSSNPF